MIAGISLSLRDQVCYRMHVPRWAWAPTSGLGAARQGGRLNRAGIEALYLALESETAIAEFQQAAALLPPATLVTYRVTLDKVVDFRGGYTSDWDPLWQDMFCDWRKMVFDDKVEPSTWVISDMCIAEGYKGILFPSSALSGGPNLVVFNSTLVVADKLVTFDPNGDLPKNQASWA
jgi:RES domain-containing protein